MCRRATSASACWKRRQAGSVIPATSPAWCPNTTILPPGSAPVLRRFMPLRSSDSLAGLYQARQLRPPAKGHGQRPRGKVDRRGPRRHHVPVQLGRERLHRLGRSARQMRAPWGTYCCCFYATVLDGRAGQSQPQLQQKVDACGTTCWPCRTMTPSPLSQPAEPAQTKLLERILPLTQQPHP